MSFGVIAREADDGELIQGIHSSSPFLMPSVPGATEKQAAPLPNEAGELCWRCQRTGFSIVEKPAGGTDKAERRREPGAAVQAPPLPWTAGLNNGTPTDS